MVKRKHKRKKVAVRRKAVKRRPAKRRKRSPKRIKVSGVKRKAAKRKPAKRKTAKRKTAKRKRRNPGRKLVKQVERRSVERVMAGKRKRRRSAPRRRVVMAGRSRHRSVGKGGSNKLLIGLAVGAAALWFLTKGPTAPTTPTNYNLPPLTSTQNYTRNTQSQDLLNYAIAGGLAVDAIIKLIEKLNTSSDQEVQNIYDVVNTTGNLEYLA